MKIFKSGPRPWQNQHETFTEQLTDLYTLGNEPGMSGIEGYKDTTTGLQQLIKDAITNNTTLRALGAGWSWTKITTPGSGIMIDTKQLNTIITISAASVHGSYTGDPSKLFLAQCGTAVWEISKFLKPRKLSLRTSGASNGQTIAGVIATGAHGSAIDVGAVQECVTGLHIITGPERHIWLERASAPVVSAAFVQRLNAELVQDDDLFYSALVSFGSFGIIHGVMFETEDIFLLDTNMHIKTYDADIQHMMETLDFNGSALPGGDTRPYHFAVSINPYKDTGNAFVYSFYKTEMVPYTPAQENAEGIGPGDDAPVFVGRITDAIPALVPVAVNQILNRSLQAFDHKMGTLNEIFSNTELHGKLLSAAIGFPASFAGRVTELMLELNRTKGPFTGLFAYRFVKGSKATLAFTRFDQTCIFELDGVFSDRTYKFYNEAWKLLEAEGIPFTFHWGKVNDMDETRVRRMYGTAVDTWINARNTLLDEDCRKVFSNALVRQWGLC
jgi:hypothetical protein